ncbi:MAG: NifU N-terminal domain-containing protein [Anaerolineae bacterium]
MSEYIEIEAEIGDDGSIMCFHTNLRLTEGEAEYYNSIEAMEEGSPVAQALSVIDGVATLRIEGNDLMITPGPDAAWHVIIAEVSAVLKDFFL